MRAPLPNGGRLHRKRVLVSIPLVNGGLMARLQSWQPILGLLAWRRRALSTTAAFATDLGQPYYKAPPPLEGAASWAGFHLGIARGWGWGRADQTDPTGFDSGHYNANGGLVGGTLGYNWQFDQFVLELECDGSWADIHGSTTGIGGGCD